LSSSLAHHWYEKKSSLKTAPCKKRERERNSYAPSILSGKGEEGGGESWPRGSGTRGGASPARGRKGASSPLLGRKKGEVKSGARSTMNWGEKKNWR